MTCLRRVAGLVALAMVFAAGRVLAIDGVDIAVQGDVVHTSPGSSVSVTATITNLGTQPIFLNGILSGVTPECAGSDLFDEYESLRPESLGPGESWEGPVIRLTISPTAPVSVQVFDLALTGGATPYEHVTIGVTYFAVDVSSTITGVDSEDPLRVAFRTAPNPFRGDVVIDFVAALPGRYEVAVFDVAGRRVALLQAGELGAGRHSLRWSGRCDSGEKAKRGVFFVRVTSANRTLKTKVLKLD